VLLAVWPPPAGPITVQRRVSQRGQIMVATQRIQVGMIPARKIVTVTAEDRSFHLDIDGETVGAVGRTTSSKIRRYKACTAEIRSGPMAASSCSAAPAGAQSKPDQRSRSVQKRATSSSSTSASAAFATAAPATHQPAPGSPADK